MAAYTATVIWERGDAVFTGVAGTVGGIGATTAVFSIVNALLLRPPPFGEKSERIVTLHSTHPTQARDWDDSPVSFAVSAAGRSAPRTSR